MVEWGWPVRITLAFFAAKRATFLQTAVQIETKVSRLNSDRINEAAYLSTCLFKSVRMLQPTIGDKAPALIGATADGRFFSQDAQVGRPAILVALGVMEPAAARAALDQLPVFDAAVAIDMIPLAPPSSVYAAALEGAEGRDRVVHIHDGSGLEQLAVDGAPAIILLDRNWRIVHVGPLGAAAALRALVKGLAPQLTSEPGRTVAAAAPVLIVPNIIAPEMCKALIAHFEASPHRPGVMASVSEGLPTAKLDERKKRRRDIELTAETPLHCEIVRVLAQRCAPEIKRAFQVDVIYADRILIARYDDTGGYFKRHRDNLAPQTAFREFAISLNLNTDEYHGGELLFPEFDDNRYNPPAGGAIIFSTALLHEAAPVTRGRRYVVLSFLSSKAAQAGAVEGG
jgi:predicted 2-oxoglutarate/Fe(II)-dependent dioxygenase YbiX